MKVYVAGKFEQKDLVREVYSRLKDLNFEIAYDWTVHKSIKPYEDNSMLASEFCNNELNAILFCDVFLYLIDEKGTTSLMEFGAALILSNSNLGKKPIIYAVGKYNSSSPWFFNSNVVRKNSIDDVFSDLEKLR